MRRNAYPFLFALSSLLTLFTLLVVSYTQDGIVATLLRADLDSATKVNALREFFDALGAWAPLAYVAMVMLEVVIAPLPGAILYAPGGAIFGGFWGGLLSLIGNVLGAALAGCLARVLGHRLIERWEDHARLRELQQRLARHGIGVVFLLRVNPLTSSDLVSYAAGLTPMPLWKLSAGTALGMAPLCWIQSYASQSLLASFPQLIYPLVLAGLAYLVLAATLVWRFVTVKH